MTRHAKEGNDFATQTDLDAERAIRAVLAAERPGDSVLGEELAGDGPSGASRRWLVDPLCGTLNFAAGTGPFAVRVVSTSLALTWVASGKRAAYVADRSLVDNVHFSPGIALCEAAGCVVTDLTGGSVLGGRGFIAAADAATSQELVRLVRHALPA